MAIGEIGHDWTEPKHTWGKREAVFRRRVLFLYCAGRVVIVQLVGMIPRDTTPGLCCGIYG